MRVCIEGDVYQIVLAVDGYNVYKNGEPALDLCDGHNYETESGAAYAILNEYSTDL